jgi:hypothetical protein
MKVPIYNIRGTVVKVIETDDSKESAKADIEKAEASEKKPKDIKDLLNEDT